VLTPTQDIILSPPIFTLGAGVSQTIRLMLRRGARGGNDTPGSERTYRLLIDEVPPTNSTAQQILVAMRVSVPVIIGSAEPKPSNLQWRARRSGAGTITVSALNGGKTFDRIHSIAATMGDGSVQAVTASGANSYILAGATRQWVLKSGGNSSTLRLRLTTRSGRSEQLVAVAQ
jgi:fimbrial chaperone protein